MEVTNIGDSTALAGIMRLVDQVQSSRARAQALADRAAFYLTLVAVGAGIFVAPARYQALGRRWGEVTVTWPHLHLNLIGVRSEFRRRLTARLLAMVHAAAVTTPGAQGATLTTE